MSDYLNNLVARALNLVPAVQPRLKSLFEPSDSPAIGSGNAFSKTLGRDTENVAANQTRGAFANNLARQESGLISSAARAPMVPPSTPMTARALSDVRKDRFGNEQIGDGESYETRTARERTAASLASSRLPGDLPSANLHGLGAAVDAAGPQTRTVAHGQSRSSVMQARVVERDSNGPAESGVRFESTGGLVAAQPTSTSRGNLRQNNALEFVATAPIFDSPQTPDQLSYAPHSAAASHPDEAPTISVTIGRIDVRAIFAPPPVQRPGRASRPAAMSLDEYHKQRGGGRG